MMNYRTSSWGPLPLLLLLSLLVPGCTPREPTSTSPDPDQAQTQLAGLTITFLDMGQGDATLLQWAGYAALIDGGPSSSGRRLVAELKRRGVKELEWVIATHPHEDHIGGLVDVFRQMTVRHYLDSGIRTSSPIQRDLLRAVQSQKATTFEIAEADRTIAMGEGLAFLLFHPSAPLLEGTGADINNNSIVGRLMYGKIRVLFASDVQEEGWRVIYSHTPGYSQGPRTLRADVLKVSHHGSADGTNRKLLDFVRPQHAVLFCAKGNDYGHPHREVLRDLRNEKVQLYRTDLHGHVTMTTDGETLAVKTARQAGGNLWKRGFDLSPPRDGRRNGRSDEGA